MGTFNCTTSVRPPSDLSFVCSWVHSIVRLQSGLRATCRLFAVGYIQLYDFSPASERPVVCLQLGTFNCTTSVRPPSDLSFVCSWVHSIVRLQSGLRATYRLFAVGYIQLYDFNPASERPIVCLQMGTFNCTTSIRPPSDLSFVCSWVHSIVRLQSGLRATYCLFANGYIQLHDFNPASERPIVCLQLGTFNCTTSIRPPSDLLFVCKWVHPTARLQYGLRATCRLFAVGYIQLHDFNPASQRAVICAQYTTLILPSSGRHLFAYHLNGTVRL